MIQAPLLAVLDGDDLASASRCLLTEPARCVMCLADTVRGEVIVYDCRRHEVGWCLKCWIRWMRTERGQPMSVVGSRSVA